MTPASLHSPMILFTEIAALAALILIGSIIIGGLA